GKKVDRVVLARLVMAETQRGKMSPYLLANGYTSEEAILPVLERQAPQWLTPASDSSAGKASATLAAPKGNGPPADVPLLVATAKSSCKAKTQGVPDWQRWIATLSEDQRAYWNALVLQCSGQGARALAAFRDVYPRLARRAAAQPMAA